MLDRGAKQPRSDDTFAEHCPICTILSSYLVYIWRSPGNGSNATAALRFRIQASQDERNNLFLTIWRGLGASTYLGDEPPDEILTLKSIPCEYGLSLPMKQGKLHWLNSNPNVWTLVSEIQGRLIPWPDPSHTIARVKDWVGTCLNKHTTLCRRNRDQDFQKPTRLLEIFDADVKLVEVDSREHYDYVTVSHRWDDEVLMLTKKDQNLDKDQTHRISIQVLKYGQPVNDFSQAFQKAIQIARECGLHYIWIDSLCIIQDKGDSGNNPDWENEARKMGDIYAGGVL